MNIEAIALAAILGGSFGLAIANLSSCCRRKKPPVEPRESFASSSSEDLVVEGLLQAKSNLKAKQLQSRLQRHSPASPHYNAAVAAKAKVLRCQVFVIGKTDSVKVRDNIYLTCVDVFVMLTDVYSLDENAIDDLCTCGWTIAGNYMIRLTEVEQK